MTIPTLKTTVLTIAALAAMQGVASAQNGRERQPTVVYNQNNTGGRGDRVISFGPTGADTVTNNSAAGGNAGRPELAVPNGSAGGGGGGR